MMEYNFNNTNPTDTVSETHSTFKGINMDIKEFLGGNLSILDIPARGNVKTYLNLLRNSIISTDNYLGTQYVLLLLAIISFFSLTIVTFTKSNKLCLISKTKTNAITILTLSLCLSSLLLFILNNVYFITLSIGLFVINIFIIWWEINQRGRTKQGFRKAFEFAMIAQMITANIGMIIYMTLYPLFRNVQITCYDYATLLWIIIAGSGLSVFMAIISQIIWSGSRLTEKTG